MPWSKPSDRTSTASDLPEDESGSTCGRSFWLAPSNGASTGSRLPGLWAISERHHRHDPLRRGTMAVDEAARHQLYNSLESKLGPEPASTLMSLLPPVGWADVATRQDLHALENGLRGETAGLRGEIAELRGEMHQGFGDLRAELHQEIGALRTELHTSIRMAVLSMIGAMFTLAGLTWAATAVT